MITGCSSRKTGQGEWEITGCAGRVGAKNSVTSNLHGGGRAVRADSLLKKWFSSSEVEQVKQKMNQLGLAVVNELERNYKQMCELALDIAVDRNGQPWLLETNPKPAREIFNRIGEKETYRKAIIRPLEYALWLYENHKKSEPECFMKGTGWGGAFSQQENAEAPERSG